jgi:FMN phosphatase YigB (HAD superfamily)
MSPGKMILFDYSGTLSLEAPLFAGPDFLMQQLEECGLRAFGIDSPQVFWNKIVNPTWVEGSTTTAGYKKVMLDRIIATLHPDLSVRRRFTLADAVAAFVNRYLRHSRIDARWKPVLRKINTHPSVKAVIATDHYAEATGAIIKFLGEWQIEAVTATEAALNSQTACLIVANSADMGVHKADPHFWQYLKTNLRLDAIGQILIVDDFGYNEQGADDYGKRHTVQERMKTTVATLEAVFSVAIEVLPVMIAADANGRNGRLENLFEEVTAVVDRFLTSR